MDYNPLELFYRKILKILPIHDGISGLNFVMLIRFTKWLIYNVSI